jgi:hypothetical protein
VSGLLAATFDPGVFGATGADVSASAKANLRTLHAELLKVQRLIGNPPFLVTSGYRSPARNEAVDGAAQSQHLTGSAADVLVQGMELPEVARRITAALQRGELVVGQVVYYPEELAPGANKGHVHIGLPNRESGRTNQQLLHLAGDRYIDLNPANWPAFAQVGVGLGLLALVVLGALLLLSD